jgi:hypothetical protein
VNTYFRPTLESLDPRIVPAKITRWTCTGTDGPYSYNWSSYWDNGIPVAGDDVILPAGTAACNFNGNGLMLKQFGALDVENGQNNLLYGETEVDGRLTLTNDSALILKGRPPDVPFTRGLSVYGGMYVNGGYLLSDHADTGLQPNVYVEGDSEVRGTLRLDVYQLQLRCNEYLRDQSVICGVVGGYASDIYNGGNLIVPDASYATVRLPIYNGYFATVGGEQVERQGVIQVGQTPGQTDGWLLATNFIRNYDSEINVVNGGLSLSGASGTYATGSPAYPRCDLYQTAHGLVQVSTNSQISTATGIFTAGDGGINSVKVTAGTQAVIYGNVYFNRNDAQSGWIGIDLIGGSSYVHGTGGADTTFRIAGTLTTCDSFQVRFNEDWSLPNPPGLLDCDAIVFRGGKSNLHACNELHHEMEPASGAWDVVHATNISVEAGCTDFGLTGPPGMPWQGTFRKHTGEPTTGVWHFGVWITDPPADADEVAGGIIGQE